MAVQIVNDFKLTVPQFVSYPLDARLSYTGNIHFRNKIGVDIFVGGEFIGSAEVDFGKENTEYSISIGAVIKSYIIKGTISTMTDVVGDSGEFVKLVPYTLHKDKNDVWSSKVYGTEQEFFAMRGVSTYYFTAGTNTPSWPDGSAIFAVNTPGSYSYDASLKSESLLYLPVYHNEGTYDKISGSIVRYRTENGVEASYDSETVDISGKPNNAVMARFNMRSDLGDLDYTKTVLDITTRRYNRATDALISTESSWEITVNYKCTPNRDFKMDLAYMDISFNWTYIEFHLKNQNTLSRESSTSENYYGSKAMYNLSVRRAMALQSDYLPKALANDVMLFGLTPELRIKKAGDSGSSNIHNVILSNTSMPVKSTRNDGMVQLEIEIEFSEETLTP